MARIKRKTVELDETSLKSLIQEVYNDSHNIRSTITALFNKWSPKVNESTDIALMGKEVINLINALARNQDQKLALTKILNDIVFSKKNNNSDTSKSKNSGEMETMTPDAQNVIRQMIAEARERGEIDV